MRLRPTNVVILFLCGVMTSTSFVGLRRQAANADDLATTSAASKGEPKQITPKPSQTDPTSSVAPKRFPGKVLAVSKLKTKKGFPNPIEPFIQADAVALGQWLVVKTVKTLVAKPITKGTKLTNATLTNTTNAVSNPVTPAVNSSKPPKKTNTAKATSAAKPIAAAPPEPEKPQDAKLQNVLPPHVTLQALPPEPSDNPTIDSHVEMRVALTKQASTVTVAASQGGAIATINGDLIERLPANIGYQVSANDSGLFINGQPVPTALWLEPDSGYIAVGNRWYRGRLLLLWQNGGVMAVNYVLLRDYLYSVVGAEMSASWSIEALKAQAVAARSYAIVHTVRHQNRSYDLDDTQRYQAYKGISTEAGSTHQAVHATAGEFISYGGGIVESLYAANQDIVDDAHSGYGMSQTGALELAQQGYQYYEILSVYYPDTSVGRIDISN